MTPATLIFKEILTISILKNSTATIDINTGTVWKIESAGIGGSSGTIVLNNGALAADQQEIAVLYSIANNQVFGSPLPYWIQPGFSGTFLNNSSFTASVSITVYDFTPEMEP
ncbi:MAG TPA: hypothetical protein VFJ43_04080 [Bacteroidia bacterium]|nr:hypothetical protein [Bacteroidia bacterium]